MLEMLAVTIAIAAGPPERAAEPCHTRRCEARVQRKHWRRVVRPHRAWLKRIAWCESRDNPNASNGTHFGLYQFSRVAWAYVGGRGDPRDASRLEQSYRAVRLLKVQGTGAWECKA